MALEGVGLGLALLAEVTKTVKSMQERSACYREGPALFGQVDGTLARLTEFANKIAEILGNNPQALPEAVLPDFVATLETVNDSLLEAGNAVTVYCSEAFFGNSSSSCIREFANKGRRFFKAKSLTSLMAKILRQTSEAENKLHHLFTHLGIAIKSDDLKAIIEDHVLPKEFFRPAFNAPMLPGKVHLDFKSRDADGTFAAPEGDLKYSVFISTSSSRVTAAMGASCATRPQLPVHGVSGMAGVGKTIALIGIGHEKDIQEHFAHGVLYMSVGATATAGHITGELCKIMRVTGATTSAVTVQSSKDLVDAVSHAALWFHGKRILFLIDDIWPSATRPDGFLPELEGLLQGSPESRIAISTRSLQIASKGGSHVDFGARVPCGMNSLAIFMSHALPAAPPSDHFLESAREVLRLCAGLPISLSVAGAAIALRVASGVDFEDACPAYVESIQAEIASHPGATFLHSAIRLSLATLEEDLKKKGHKVQGVANYSSSDLYISLCVLENQQFAPVPVLARMWNISEVNAENVCVSFSSMSLAKISTRTLDGRKQLGLNIHDLHLEYCRRNVEESGEERVWHRRLLNGHLGMDTALNETSDGDELDGPLGLNMLEFRPRAWWKDDIANAEYIRKYLSRHLQRAELFLELGATMLDIRWICAQGMTGGVFCLRSDFEILQRVVEEKYAHARTLDPSMSCEIAPVKVISDALLPESHCLKSGPRVISHMIFCYLFLFSKTNEWMHRFLERLKSIVPKPFLEPVVSFYEWPGDDLKFHIELKAPGRSELAYFSTDFCDKYSASGSQHDVLVFCLTRRNRLAWLKGHEKNVSAVKFNWDASKVISGSFDANVILWDWKETETPSLILKGHKRAVTAIALSGDNRRLFSGSLDGTVRMWDMITGEFFREFHYGAEVECVASNPESEIMAVGTRDGRLRCTNWVSGDCQFEYGPIDDAAITAVQFATDGKFLVCGTSAGNATAWRSADGRQSAIVKMPGSITHISFHPEADNVILGSSRGEIRHWILTDQQLSAYNIAMARPVNGISFLHNGSDVIVGIKYGFARAWSGPKSNPHLDFESYRSNLQYNFSLSFDGTIVAAATHDDMIRIWNPHTGVQAATYSAPDGGSRLLALSANGSKIASVSPSGVVRLWMSERPPSDQDGDFTLATDGKNVSCLSFCPSDLKFLVCLKDEVHLWDLKTRQKLGHVPSHGSLDASFCCDGRFVVIGNSTRTTIWDAASRGKVFDTATAYLPTFPSSKTTNTAVSSAQTLSVAEAKNIIKSCGPTSHRICPSFLKNQGTVSTDLTVDNISLFVNENVRPEHRVFCKDVFVQSLFGTVAIYKLRK